MAPGGTRKVDGGDDGSSEWNGSDRKGDGTISPDVPLEHGCDDQWCWNHRDKSHEVRLYGPRLRTAHFHPNWSNGTAGVRGTRALESGGGRCYWEVRVSQRVFGTSMMFGVGTRRARLHVDSFVNLLGEDEHGWGLSHKGALWHDGHWTQYTKPFRENEATTVGLLYDGRQGTLTYYKDGRCLGVAFAGLNHVGEPLFPIVCSTAAKTEMTLGQLRRDYRDLQDRCRAVILRHVCDGQRGLESLDLPSRLKAYVAEDINASTAPPLQQQHHHHSNNHGADGGATWHRNGLIACCYV